MGSRVLIRHVSDQLVMRFDRLDGAMNNAGAQGQPGPLTEQSAGMSRVERAGRRCADMGRKYR
jgi:hypothetical protein